MFTATKQDNLTVLSGDNENVTIDKKVHDGKEFETIDINAEDVEEPSNISETNNEQGTASSDASTEETAPARKVCISDTHGNFFFYACLPILGAGGSAFLMMLTFYLMGQGWHRSPLSVALGLVEVAPQPSYYNLIINAHVFLAFASLGMVLCQVLSVRLFSSTLRPTKAVEGPGELSKDEPSIVTFSRRFHRITGRFIYTVWTAVVITGYLVLSFSDYHSNLPTRERQFVTHGVGTTIAVMLCTNMTVGIFAAACAKYRDMILHKGCMFFALKWAISPAFASLLTTILQAFYPRCYVGGIGLLIGSISGEVLQLIMFVLAACRYDPKILRNTFVRLNLIVWVLHTLSYVAALTLTLTNTTNGEIDAHAAEECFQTL